MPLFSYKARDPRGTLVEGVLEAASADALAGQLINTGASPIAIRETMQPGARKSIDIADLLRRKSVRMDDLIVFTRQLYSLVRAGVPIIRGLSGLATSTRSRPLADALNAVVRALESGRDLSSALAEHPAIFAPIVISTVRVGENSGRLEEAILQISEYLQRDKDTRERIKSALRYPTLVIVAIGIAIAIINIWVIPAFAGIFARANVELPWATKVLLATSAFFVAWWPAMLGGIFAALAGFRAWKKTPDGRYRWDRFRFQLPVFGDIIRQASLSRFARGFSMSLRSGVPLIQGLTVVAQAVDNAFLAQHILAMREGIGRGDTLTRTAASTGQFTPLVLQMMEVGEETGQVDDLLAEVAAYYERDVDYAIRNIGSAIEPILLVAMGVMVLILALGVFLPMWDLSTTFK